MLLEGIHKSLLRKTWKYNIRSNINLISTATMRSVAVTYSELGVAKNFIQTF